MEELLDAQPMLLQETSIRAEAAARLLANTADCHNSHQVRTNAQMQLIAARELAECATIAARAAGESLAVANYLDNLKPSELG